MLALETSDSVTVNGATLAFQETGSGAPVVLVHGGVSDLRTWSRPFEALGRTYRTIAYSRRYARPNAAIAPDADDPVQAHVDDLAALVEKLDAAPAHVIGHSWGGLVSLLLAIDRPDLFRSLILVEPPAVTLFLDMPPRPGQLAGLLLRRPRAAVAVIRLGALAMGPAEKAFRRGDDEAAIRAFGHGVLGKRRFRALSDERYRQIWENRGPDRAQILGAGFPSLADDDVAAVDIPVLLVCGRESPAVFHRVSQRLLHLLPDARRVVIDGASHIVHEDAPESFNTEALRFLSMH